MGTRRSRLSDFFLPVVFLASIVLVLAVSDWHGRTDALQEQQEDRSIASLPSVPHSIPALYHYFSELSRFLDDHFGLRAQAIDLRGKLGFWWLDDPLSSEVFAGRDHWLFMAGDREFADVLHSDPLSQAALRQWREGIEARRSWLAARGIRYLFVLAPDKRSIYPEMLPPVRPRPGPTRREQLDQAMAGQEAFLDLTDALRAHKSDGQLYYKWDTHWNWLGTYYGYGAVAQRLGLIIEPMSLGQPLVPEMRRGDLGRMAGVRLLEQDQGPRASCPREIPPPGPGLFDNPFKIAGRVYEVPSTTCSSGRGRLLMFHDSFGGRWSPWLSTQFEHAVYVWRQPSFAELKRMVEIDHPTVVIEERLERFLIWPLRP